MSYYMLRIGEGSKYIKEAKRGGFAAIGWSNVPDLQELGSLDKIKKSVAKNYPNYTVQQVATQSGQLYRFSLEMQAGDIVVSPFGKGEYLGGEVGDYYYKEAPNDGCPYHHRRQVSWKSNIILKEDMSTNLAYSAGATLTIFSLDKYGDEIEQLIAGKKFTPADKPERIRDIVLSALLELNGKQFEDFISSLLETIGFSAETTQYVGDKGIDVNGILDAEGLADITLRVQVKRVRSSIGNKEVLALRGALSQSEHGCLITISNFTNKALEEAEAPNKTLIKLIDGNDLAGLILKHYDDLDERYKSAFNIRKKKDYNIEDQFESVDTLEGEKEQAKETTREKLDVDTLLCAAQEDGFQRAFLGKKAWWAVRLGNKMIPAIKYIAMYQVAPISKITYYGEVDHIEPYQDTGKYILFLKGDPIKLDNPVGLGNNPHLKPQGHKYTKLENILKAKTLDDIFG